MATKKKKRPAWQQDVLNNAGPIPPSVGPSVGHALSWLGHAAAGIPHTVAQLPGDIVGGAEKLKNDITGGHHVPDWTPPKNQQSPKNADIDPFTKKKWQPIAKTLLPEQKSTVKSYKATGSVQGNLFSKGKGPFHAENPADLTDSEYNTLRTLASKGNSLAQKILDKGKYKAQGYPSVQQDINQLTNPFINAIKSLPAQAAVAQAQQPDLSFNTAEGTLNNLLQQMGAGPAPALTPETQTYINSLQNIVNSAPTISTPGPMGLPSMDQALGDLAKAGSQYQASLGNSDLTNALLQHALVETEYNGIVPGTSGATNTIQTDPGWLQQLIASVTGNTTLNNNLLAGVLPTNTNANAANPNLGTGTNPSSTGG